MSAIDFVEVARRGDQPVVEMGHVNVQEVVASVPHRGARLRFFSHRIHGHSAFTFSKTALVLTLVNRLALPDSKFRNALAHFGGKFSNETSPLFFKATDVDVEHLEPLHFRTWHELEPHWKTTHSNHVLWISAEGHSSDLLRLLDAIRADTADVCDDAPPAELPQTVPDRDAPQQEAIAFRNELLAMNWPDGKRVAALAGTRSTTNPHQYAARQRSNGALLGVWDPAERSYRHPDFQFDAHGAIRPAVAELLKVLPADEEDKNGWRRAFWLYSPHPLLSGETPANAFVADPQRVIDAAKEEFCGDANAHW